MKLSQEQYNQHAEYFPVQRGNVRLNNLEILNAILCVLENGCKWRALPPCFGNWHTIYTRMSRWTKKLFKFFHEMSISN
jgi:transposase